MERMILLLFCLGTISLAAQTRVSDLPKQETSPSTGRVSTADSPPIRNIFRGEFCRSCMGAPHPDP